MTLTVSPGFRTAGLIGLLPWLSKSQTGMFSRVRASGLPGLASILIDLPSRCMWPATPRTVSGWLIGPRARLDGARLDRSAQEVQQVGRRAGAVAEALLHVGQRGGAVAQRAVAVLGTAGQLDRRRASAGSAAAVMLSVAGASRSSAALRSGSLPASRL